MREAMPKLRLWAHISREVTQAWAIPELADQCGLGGNELIVTGPEKDGVSGEMGDDTLANMYSACLVTLGIGMGEGWGYPLAESLACGRPVIHCDYAGGAALVPQASWRVKAQAMHVESAYALKRPIIDPGEFADAALAAADWVLREPEVASAYCAGSVRHLGWDRLWPRWEAWFRQGLRELE
jgi:glycosyltransferase involved in cell wall biosynthesis